MTLTNTTTAQTIQTLAADIRQVDGENDLGAAALAEELVKLGWTKVVKPLVAPLDAYKDGDLVSVLGNDQAWREGRVRDIAREGGKVQRLSVDTDRGPVTVASTHRIRHV